MRRMLLLTAVFLMLMCFADVCSAEDGFDDLFWGNSVSFVPVDIENYPVLKDAVDEDGRIFGKNVTLIGISPDESTYLFSTIEDGQLIAVRNGQVRLMKANEKRGVPDKYGDLKYIADYGPAYCMDHAGITWSPDGRYFAMTSKWMLEVVKYNFAPMLFDAETGEFFLLMASKHGKGESTAAPMVEAAFSPDGTYFYYKPYRKPLRRFNLKNGKTVTFPATDMDDYVYTPSMYVTEDERIICAYCPYLMKQSRGLLVYHREGIIGRVTQYEIPGSFVDGTHTGFSLSKFLYRSGSCLAVQHYAQDDFFTYFPWGAATDAQKSFALRYDEGGVSVFNVDTRDISSEYWNLILHTQSEPLKTSKCSRLLGSALSPDGKYVFCVVLKGELYAAVVVELDSLRVIEVELPETVRDAVLFWESSSSRVFRPGAIWLENGDIIAYTSEGQTGLFCFKKN